VTVEGRREDGALRLIDIAIDRRRGRGVRLVEREFARVIVIRAEGIARPRAGVDLRASARQIGLRALPR